MCGFDVIINGESMEKCIKNASLIKHRGPDFTGVWKNERVMMIHHRLAIVAPKTGQQPIWENQRIIAVNGEIYNHHSLEQIYIGRVLDNASDCLVLAYMFTSPTSIKDDLNSIRGMFAFVMITKDGFIVARDPIGIIPLYYGIKGKEIHFASEVKCLHECDEVYEFPPGSYMMNNTHPEVYYQPQLVGWPLQGGYTDILSLRSMFIDAVKCHLMADVPYAVLLSGGLDSSIVASIVKSLVKPTRIHTFSIGVQGADSPDLKMARIMADYLDSIHHEIRFSVDDALHMIPDVIWHIETYDRTTIRASTPMLILGKAVKEAGFKMVLSGEGSDEIFGGYLHFNKAPNPSELHSESSRLVLGLNKKDCLRANKSMMASGVEVRVPFLDTEFLDYAMNLDPKHKMSSDRIEKKVLREAFRNMLPPEIYKRQKEQFSDGVGYSWIEGIQNYALSKYQNFDPSKYPVNTPRTPEEMLYRDIFSKMFEGDKYDHLIPWGFSTSCSTPHIQHWDNNFINDPTGRRK
jgi:asparagine synthase (glutamine-hydrolysing)